MNLMQKTFAAASIALAALAVSLPALAQSTILNQQPAPTNTTGQSEVLTQSIPVTGGTLHVTTIKPAGQVAGPSGVAQSFAPTSGSATYTKTAPATAGFRLTFGDAQVQMLLEPSGTVTYGYATFSPSPLDGAVQCVFSTKAVTYFYPTANTGQTVNDATTTLAANGRNCWTYSLANTTWDRSL